MIPNNIMQIKAATSSKNLSILAMAFLASATFTQEAFAIDGVNFVAGIIQKHDDNIFKSENNEVSDNITSLQAGVKIDKQISLQRFTAKALIARHNFNKNDNLDFTSKNYEAAWHWALTPRFTGKLSADRVETLNNFNDTRDTQRNIRLSQNQQFLADFNPSGGWHYLAGVSRRTLDNSRDFVQDSAFTANSVDFGVKYVLPSSSSITFLNHVRDGEFDDRTLDQAQLLDDKYDEKESGIDVDWSLTVKSRVTAGLSYLKREHDNFSQRDFSGAQGHLGYAWDPTKRLKVGIYARSRIYSFQTQFDNYTRNNTLAITPSFGLTPKLTLKGSINFSKRSFKGTGPQAQLGSSRTDDYSAVGIGLEWKPTRQSAIQFGVSHANLDSNDDFFDYEANTASISGSIQF